MLKELLAALLQAVMIAAVPVCIRYAGKGITAITVYFSARAQSETAKKYLADIGDAITTAVAYTSQTYVDNLKKSEKFTKENQKEALQKAVEKAQELMTAEAAAFIETAYGDLTTYLQARIEAEVRAQKATAPIVMEGIAVEETAAASPDVTAVVTTAAATAAAVAQKAIAGATPTPETLVP